MVLVQIRQVLLVCRRLVIVKLRVVLTEQGLQGRLRARPLQALFVLVLVLGVFTSELHILFLFKITVLQQCLVLLEEVWLAIGWLATLSSTGRDSTSVRVQLLDLIALISLFVLEGLTNHVVHRGAFDGVAVDKVR